MAYHPTLYDALARMGRNEAGYTKVDLEDQIIGDRGAARLAAALERNTTTDLSRTQMLTLLMCGNSKCVEGTEEFYRSINFRGVCRQRRAMWLVFEFARTVGCSVATLDLGGNNIGPEGAARLAAALERNTTVTTLCLHGNIADESITDRITNLLKRN